MMRFVIKHRGVLVALLVLALLGIGIRSALEKRAQKRRAAHYEAVLQTYAGALTPGMVRKDVEGYLQTKGMPFRQMCCVERKAFSEGAYDDLVKIGQEDAPWFCSQNNVYVAFQFAGAGSPNVAPHADPSDRLKSVTIFHWLEGCL